MIDSPYYHLGVGISCATQGITPEELLRKRASLDTAADHREENYGALQRVMCKYASLAYEGANRTRNLRYHLMEKLAYATPWWPELDRYSDAVIEAVGRVHRAWHKSAEEAVGDDIVRLTARCAIEELGMDKQAFSLKGMGGALASLTPGALKSILAGGALLGVGGGSAAWLANRAVSEDAPQLEAMKEKIRYYNHLTDEIEDELEARGVPATRGAVEDVAQDII